MKESEYEGFHYTYSATQKEEVEKIRKKYLQPEEADKLTQLKRLDASVTQKGMAVSIFVGIIGTLGLGFGMCCSMVWNELLPGILIGLFGMGMIALAYPLYSKITEKEKARLAPEILRLTDELMNGELNHRI